MTLAVLDASALLASVFGEPETVGIRDLMPNAIMSAANWAEFIQKSRQKGVDTHGLREEMEASGFQIMPVTAGQAEIAADLWQIFKSCGLSLGDRLCIALAMDMQTAKRDGRRKPLTVTLYTADRIWINLQLAVPVVCIRPNLMVHEQAR
jgi:ribonuclease VapC